MKIHELKCWPNTFWEMEKGSKTADFRKSDREFEDGDLIDLIEYVPTIEEFVANGGKPEDAWDEDWHPGTPTGDRCWLQIIHVADSSYGFGIPTGYVVLSVRRVKFVAV